MLCRTPPAPGSPRTCTDPAHSAGAAAELLPPPWRAGLLLPPVSCPTQGTAGTAHATPPALGLRRDLPALPASSCLLPGQPRRAPPRAPPPRWQLKTCPDLSSLGSKQAGAAAAGAVPVGSARGWGHGVMAGASPPPSRWGGRWSQTGCEGNGWARASPGRRFGREQAGLGSGGCWGAPGLNWFHWGELRSPGSGGSLCLENGGQWDAEARRGRGGQRHKCPAVTAPGLQSQLGTEATSLVTAANETRATPRCLPTVPSHQPAHILHAP